MSYTPEEQAEIADLIHDRVHVDDGSASACIQFLQSLEENI